MKTLKNEATQYLQLTNPSTKIFQKKCKFVYWIRKFEFIFFNLVLADGLFIMTHCLSVISLEGIQLELNQFSSFWGKTNFLLRLVGSMLIFIAILVDILELFIVSINISRESYYTIPHN